MIYTDGPILFKCIGSFFCFIIYIPVLILLLKHITVITCYFASLMRRIRAAVARFSRHQVDAFLFKGQGDVFLTHTNVEAFV